MADKTETPDADKAAKRAAKIKKLSAKTPEQLLAGVAARREKAADSPDRLAKLDKKEAKIKARAPSAGA